MFHKFPASIATNWRLIPGLSLVVQPTGSKTYRLWTRIHGAQVNLPIGDAVVTSATRAPRPRLSLE
jgi:hypothetical protein